MEMGSNFQFVKFSVSLRASKLNFREFSSGRSGLTLLKVVQTLKLPIYPYSWFGDAIPEIPILIILPVMLHKSI